MISRLSNKMGKTTVEILSGGPELGPALETFVLRQRTYSVKHLCLQDTGEGEAQKRDGYWQPRAAGSMTKG